MNKVLMKQIDKKKLIVAYEIHEKRYHHKTMGKLYEFYKGK